MHSTPPPLALLPRRRLLGRALAAPLSPLLALAGCASPWPEVPPGPGSRSASDLLRACATTMGLSKWRGSKDANLRIGGAWWATPALRLPGQQLGPLQLRMLTDPVPALTIGLTAQVDGLHWQALCLDMETKVWIQPSVPTTSAKALYSRDTRPVAQLLADLHRLMVAAPLVLADFSGPVNWAEPQTIDGRRCDHLHLSVTPGLGHGESDRLSLFIDRDEGRLRRLQVSLTALGPDQRVDVALGGHRALDGITWPTRWQAGALSWQLTGLDVDRGYGFNELDQTPWAAPADAPARPLPPG